MTLQHLASQRLSTGTTDAGPTSTHPAPAQDLPCPPAFDALIATLAHDIKVVRAAAGLQSKGLTTRELAAGVQSVIMERYIPDEATPKGQKRSLPFAPKSMAWIHDLPNSAAPDMFRKLADILDSED
jgi:hypothetical protein